MLVKPVDLVTLPESLKNRQFVDLTDNCNEVDYRLDESELLKALSKEAEYYQTHKLLLTKALKWERQLQNPCILLRGQALRQTEAWLKIAHTHSNPSLSIQTDFVKASLEQPTDVRLGVFIASDARDLDFASRLNDKLQVQGESTWFEPDKAILGPDYTTQVEPGVEQAENFLFIVSQDSLADAATLEELHLAAALSKRIITVSYQKIDRSQVPSALNQGIWVEFSSIHGDEFSNGFETLYRILKSHPEHVQGHTQLLIRAVAWEQSGKDDSALLRGKDLQRAKLWHKQAKNQTPKPSELQLLYLKASRELPFRKVKKRSILSLSIGITLLVMLARIFGLFERVELVAYDHFIQQRPNEIQDDRFLMVVVDEESTDFLKEKLIARKYRPGIGTISDDALSHALENLEKYRPRLVGLDFYRDFPGLPIVKQGLRESDNLISICKSGYEGKGVEKAPEIPIERVGFNDFLSEGNNETPMIRRHYLMQSADNIFCNTPTSFSLLLAERYLQQEEVPYTSPMTPEGNFRVSTLGVGERTVKSLFVLQSGPYAPRIDTLAGYQTLLNFRTVSNPTEDISKDPNHFAPSVSLKALLEDKVPAELIEDRIVLIGYVNLTDRNADYWYTPHGGMPGVFVQGQMTSQLISAALDDRALISWFSLGQELLWVVGWAMAGGIIIRQTVRVPRLVAGLTTGGLLLYGSCYGAMVYGALWLPLVLPSAAFVLTAGGGAMLNYRLRHS